MDDAKIRRIVREEMRGNDSKGRFSLQNIPVHTHNGTDSVPIASPTIVYAGIVPGVIGTLLTDYFLPNGWTAEYDSGSGFYIVTHNLGTRLYSVVVSKNASASAGGIIPRVEVDENAFYVTMFNSALSATTGGFNFILAQINNKRSPLVQYTDYYQTI